MTSAETILVGGFLQDPSGAGLIHGRLAAGLASSQAPQRLRMMEAMPLLREVPATWRRLVTRVPKSDVLIWSSTPLPLRVPRSTALFPIIYDLRWARTRSAAARLYRAGDLVRLLRRSSAIFTISNAVASQLSLLTDKEIVVLPMGPGQFERFPQPSVKNSKTIVLIGNAPHKQNEYAARLLTSSALVRSEFSVVAVRVSDDCADILRRGMPSGRVQAHGTIEPGKLAEILGEASVLISLGTDEGFGFPYVEASYFGCDVVAPSTPITREVLPSTGPNLMVSVSLAELEHALGAWDAHRIEQAQRSASRRSWADAPKAVMECLERYL